VFCSVIETRVIVHLIDHFTKRSNQMSEFTSFDKLQQQVFPYFEKPETLQRAYDLLTEAVPHFPEQANLLYNWRYCAAALLGKTDLALQLFQEALDAGYWWGEDYLRSDTDLASLQDLPEFNRLVEISETRRQAAQAASKPLLLTLPLPKDATPPLPMLLALHGNATNAPASVEYWESAVHQGWLTALPQSSQVSGPEAFVWNDLELGADEIKTHYQGLSEKHPVDSAKVVVGGFSKGGEMAIWLVLKEVIPMAGFIAVNPGGPFIQEIENWLPLLEACKTLTDLRGFFLVGENDANIENIKALHKMLNSHELTCDLVVAPEIGHDFPADFDQILARALEFVTKP
jgi:predicted esterase